MVLYQNCVFDADLKSNIAAGIHSVFSLAEILTIFLSETTKTSGSPDTILKSNHLRTIHAMLALNWLTGFRGEDF
jgi:hypothetical protein